MPTTPVAFYSSLIDEEIRRLACSSIRDGSSIEWCSIKKMLDFSSASGLLSQIHSVPEDKITSVLKPYNRVLNVYLIYAIHRLASYYIQDAGPTFFRERRHLWQVEELQKEAFNALIKLRCGRLREPALFTRSRVMRHADWYHETPNYIRRLIHILDRGVLYHACNPRGNFANMCRAIVSRSSGMPDWHFDDDFLAFLGPQSISSTVRKHQ